MSLRAGINPSLIFRSTISPPYLTATVADPITDGFELDEVPEAETDEAASFIIGDSIEIEEN